MKSITILIGIIIIISGFIFLPSAKAIDDLEPGPIFGDMLFKDDTFLENSNFITSESGDSTTVVPGIYDTSEYMIGKVALDVVFMESNGIIDTNSETWTTPRQDTVIAEINGALNWWVAREPKAQLSFIINAQHRSVTTGYEPISRPSYTDGSDTTSSQWLWINDALSSLGYQSDWTGIYNYANDIRDNSNTDWSFIIFVVDSANDLDGEFADDTFAYSYVGGPFMVMTYKNDNYGILNMDAVCAHEIGHTFYALDEYSSSLSTASSFSGYLNVQNSNHEIGGTTNDPCIMRSQILPYTNNNICTQTREMLGWKDTDNDEILDILDVEPISSLTRYSPDPTIDTTPTYTGTATVMPLTNLNPLGPNNDVSISVITAVQYRVDGGSWLSATASNGLFNEHSESFTFTPSALALGEHTFEVRARDSQNIFETTYPSDTLSIVLNYVPSKPSIICSTHEVGVWSSKTEAKFTFSSSTPQGVIEGYYTEIDHDADTLTPNDFIPPYYTRTYNVNTGIWYFHVRAKNSLGYYSETAHFGPIYIDATAPQIYEVSIYESSPYLHSFGNTLYYSDNMRSAPQIFQYQGKALDEHGLSYAEATSAFGDFPPIDTTPSIWSFQYDVVDVDSGTKYISAIIYDAPGNPSRKELICLDDNTPPSLTGIPIPQGVIIESVLWSDATTTWSWSPASDICGIDGYQITIRRDSINGPIVHCGYTNLPTYSIYLENEVTYYLETKAVDNVGNIGLSTISTQGITVDATAPSNVEIVTDDIFMLTPYLELTAMDSQSGLGQMRFANKGDVWWPVEQVIETPHWNNNGYVFAREISEPQASSLILHFSEINLREIGAGGTLIGDDGTIMGGLPPTIPDSLKIFDSNGNVVASYYGVNAIYDVSVLVPGSYAQIVYSCPDGTDDLSATSWGFRMESYEWLDSIKWSDWVPYSSTHQWQLEPDPDGLYRVYFQARDSVGNEVLPFSKLLNYLGWDNTPPEVNVIINNGVKYIFGSGGNPPGVSVKVISIDELGGSGIMSYRSSRDGVVWADWNDWPSTMIGPGPGQPVPVSTIDPNLLTESERVIWDYYVNGYYPLSVNLVGNSIIPSRSLIDAGLEDGTLCYSWAPPYLQVFDQKSGIFEGDTAEYRIQVNDISHPLKFTLAWQDAFTPVLDNLNLLVTAPDGKIYRGNNFIGDWSVPTQQSNIVDNVNHVEKVWIQNPLSGVYKVEVIGYNFELSHAEPFALVISGGLTVGYGNVIFDRTRYDDSDVVNIRIEDTNCPAQKLTVTIASYIGETLHDQETAEMFVTQLNSGVFAGCINLEYGSNPIPGDFVLQVEHGMTIVCRYADASPAHDSYARAGIDIALASVGEIVLDGLRLSKGWGTKYIYIQVRDRAGNIATAYDTIEFISPDSNVPLEVLTYQEVNITLTVAGIESNTIEIILLEDGKPVQSMAVTRFLGDPHSNSQTMTARIYYVHTSIDGNTTSVVRDYAIQIRYLGRSSGGNPFTIDISSGNSTETIRGSFTFNQKGDWTRYNVIASDTQHEMGMVCGNTAKIEVDSNALISRTLEGNAEFYFSAQPRSTCLWDFGDGTVTEGAFVNHEYSAPGIYTVTLTYLDDEMHIIRQMRFDVVV